MRHSQPHARLNTTQKLLLGGAIGLMAGCLGAIMLIALYGDFPNEWLALVIGCPVLTGTLSALRPARQKVETATPVGYRTQFTANRVHMGSRLGLHHFLMRFGISRGIFKSAADELSPEHHAAAAAETAEEILRSIEKQYPTVTTITYDTQTNAPTSDTISREQLATARLALLSMDHTKQIPH